MKIFGISRKCHPIIMVVAIFMAVCFVGVAVASSGGDHKAKGWVATDTYKVMNFAVLAIGLFFILRKPVSQALSGRISGIKEQLDELEAKKSKAEKELAEYSKKLSLLDQEGEKIVDDYVRQGNDAKARIIKEAESAAIKIEEQAIRNVEHEFKQAKLKLQAEILEKAFAQAEKNIKKNITAKDQNKLVDEYLEKVML